MLKKQEWLIPAHDSGSLSGLGVGSASGSSGWNGPYAKLYIVQMLLINITKVIVDYAEWLKCCLFQYT